MSESFDHLKITYLTARYNGNGCTLLEHSEKMIKIEIQGAAKNQALSYMREGFAIERGSGHVVLIGPGAILSIERSNDRGYTPDVGR